MARILVSDETNLAGGQISYEQRQRDIAEEVQQEQHEAELAKKNHNFVMLFKGKDRGTEMLRKLIKENHNAAELFMYLTDQMDRSNALVASGKALADVLGLSEPTISRAIKYLVENDYIARFKSGGSSVFVANPDLVWSAWATGKHTCLFNNSKVLLSKNEQDSATIKRFNVVMEKRQQEAEELAARPAEKRGPGRPKKTRSTDESISAEELEAHGQQRLLA